MTKAGSHDVSHKKKKNKDVMTAEEDDDQDRKHHKKHKDSVKKHSTSHAKKKKKREVKHVIKRKEKTVELEHMDKANIIGPSYARKKQPSTPGDGKASTAKKKGQTPSKEQVSKESTDDQEEEEEEPEAPPPPPKPVEKHVEKPAEKPEKPPKQHKAVEKHHNKEKDDRIEMRKLPQKRDIEKEESSWEDTKLLLRPVKRKPSKFIVTYELSEDGDEAPPTDETGFAPYKDDDDDPCLESAFTGLRPSRRKDQEENQYDKLIRDKVTDMIVQMPGRQEETLTGAMEFLLSEEGMAYAAKLNKKK